MRSVPFALAGLACLVTGSCGGPARTGAQAPAAAATTVPADETTVEVVAAKQVSLADVGLDAASLDRSADPCQDFYQFACGGWLARAEIPADRSRWSSSFETIDQRNEQILRGILEAAASTQAADPVLGTLGAFYRSCMDEAAVEAQGLKPIEPLLGLIKGVKDPRSLARTLGLMHRARLFALWSVGQTQDYKDATRVIAEIHQSGLGLPDRDYYLGDEPAMKEARKTYSAHLERMFRLYGMGKRDARLAARDVLAVETELARISKTRVELRDPKGTYNKIDREGLAKAAPHFVWDAYFQSLGFPDIADVTVTSVPYVEGVDALLAKVQWTAWRNYLVWRLLDRTAPYLGKKFVDEDFTLTAAVRGQKALPERWKRCVAATDRALGELLAQPFVAAHFTAEAKTMAERAVAAIAAAFREDVTALSWMDDKTRARALDKLAGVVFQVGYPSRWRTYDFPIDPRSYAANMLAAIAFDQKRELTKVGKPVDREEWLMTPPTVNAYYNPQLNQMTFPAGILQPPFFSPQASEAVNLGAIGMVVAHELTHGFDDQGAQFAANGNLEDWWQPETASRFRERTECIEKQYDRYEPLPGVPLNGKLTLGENIADLGGVKTAFRAYRALREGATEVQIADGFDEDQQFFLAFGQVWCTKMHDEEARRRVKTDPHSPGRFRVNGPLANLPEFSEAFHCPAGAPMHPEEQCSVW